MVIVDAHCDTLTKAVDNKTDIFENNYHWDIKRALKYDGFVQFMSIFQNPDIIKPTFKRALYYIEKAESFEKKYPQFKICKSYLDIKHNLTLNKVCALLTIEGGDILHGKTENLQTLYDKGIRSITLTWNYANELGDGAKESKNGGLTPFGHEIVKSMQDLGMIVDVSHADEKTFWDIIDISIKPIIASHSNAGAVHENPRNLNNDQLKAISDIGGVIGVNFYTEFIDKPGRVNSDSLIRHIEHICEVAGEDAVGLGADFDGMESLPEDVKGVESLDIILNKLARMNYSETVIRKITGGNFLRVISEIL
ncbi:MAG: M19 family membrane dipeptidase [Clostridiaceae bacterium]|nr:M19 family membrane dipeptidase [Clostridiaceae bacterium]